jgi:coenzyme F420-dependent glucose-6-phosphate dehydrogenase
VIELGYALSSEEHAPNDLVRFARTAEELGFGHAFISDHFHPWIDRQGQSPFVWSVIGAIAASSERLRLGTGVTCPLIRMHPALVAQAAATSESLMPGRFVLGLGTGENLNEHVLGDRWPAPDERVDMLEEAIEVIRQLWSGDEVTFRGEYYVVEYARLYTLPERPPPIAVAAVKRQAAELAGRAADALISVAPKREIVDWFRGAGGEGKPCHGQLHACWAPTVKEARRIAFEIWPNVALKGSLGQELARPSYFEEAAQMVSEDDVAELVPCGPDPDLHVEHLLRYVDAGFDHVYVHGIGPAQDSFLQFYANEVRPKLERAATDRRAAA